MWSSISGKDWILLLLGAVVGAVVSIAAERLRWAVWDRWLGRKLRFRWTRYRGVRALRYQPIAGEFIVVGKRREHVYVYQHSPAGFDGGRLICRLAPERSVDESLEELPDELRPIPTRSVTRRIAMMRKELESSPSSWNEKKFGLTALHVGHHPDDESPLLHLDFHPSDYATFQVMTRSWHAFTEGRDLAKLLTSARLRSVLPGLSHSFGINATVVTADGQLLLVDRSGETRDARTNVHISVNEGMRVDDRDEQNRPDPYRTLRRGIKEELGFDPETAGTFHTLICDAGRYQWALLGHVDLRGTNWTAAAIRAARGVGVARDAWEAERIWPEPFTPRRVLELLTDREPWIAHGWLNLLLSGIYAFPDKQTHLNLLRLLTVESQTSR